MRRMKSTNVLLTVNAVLMSALLWAQLVSGGGAGSQGLLSSEVHAQAQSSKDSWPATEGVPNAGKQRQATIEELRAMRSVLESTRSMLQSGSIKVQVTNLDELKDSAASAASTK